MKNNKMKKRKKKETKTMKTSLVNHSKMANIVLYMAIFDVKYI